MSDIVATYRLTDDAIEKMIKAATAKAREIASPSGVAVVDAGGILRSWVLMDGATPLAFEAVYKKARTAVFTGVASGGVPLDIAARLSAVMTEFANLPGGFPIMKDGRAIGAIGAGGGTHEADAAIAGAALAAIDLSS